MLNDIVTRTTQVFLFEKNPQNLIFCKNKKIHKHNLPDWMTSSKVAPMPVLRVLSLLKTSGVRYFFSKDLQSCDSWSFLKPASSLSIVAWSAMISFGWMSTWRTRSKEEIERTISLSVWCKCRNWSACRLSRWLSCSGLYIISLLVCPPYASTKSNASLFREESVRNLAAPVASHTRSAWRLARPLDWRGVIKSLFGRICLRLCVCVCLCVFWQKLEDIRALSLLLLVSMLSNNKIYVRVRANTHAQCWHTRPKRLIRME